MSYKTVPFGTAEEFNVVIEIERRSRLKHEYDEATDELRLDWVFDHSAEFPYHYGFIPQTRAGDGDHLDVFVISELPLVLGTVVACRPIGIITMLDRGEEDDKLLAVPVADHEQSGLRDLDGLPAGYRAVFQDFFAEVARQKKKTIEIIGYGDLAVARERLTAAHRRYSIPA